MIRCKKKSDLFTNLPVHTTPPVLGNAHEWKPLNAKDGRKNIYVFVETNEMFIFVYPAEMSLTLFANNDARSPTGSVRKSLFELSFVPSCAREIKKQQILL